MEAVIEKDVGEQNARRANSLSLSFPDLSTAPIDSDFEKILVWAQAKYGNQEFIAAKEEFFWKSGKVFHDDPFYEERMSYFLDYFLLQRPILTEGKMLTPFANYMQQVAASEVLQLNPEQPTDRLTGFVHSIFQILKNSDSKLSVEDLFTDKRYTVNQRPIENFKAVSKKDIFQGFLYVSGERLFLSHGIVFHPAKTLRILKKQLKKIRKSEDLDIERELAKLSLKHLKYLRHAHVDPRRIYSAET